MEKASEEELSLYQLVKEIAEFEPAMDRADYLKGVVTEWKKRAQKIRTSLKILPGS